MDTVELRDPDQARTYLLQGLWLQRAMPPMPPLVRRILAWALEYASSGKPLPPLGFLADVGVTALGQDQLRTQKEPIEIPGWPSTLARSYEDQVLGKIYADWTFERAADALKRYAEKDQTRGLCYIVRQIQERGKLGGVELSPAILKAFLSVPPEELLAQGYELLLKQGPMPELVKRYEGLVAASRRMAELLGPEDILALEQRTALADMGQYVAHRQIVTLAARLEAELPARPLRALAGRREVPTRILDEDQYPVGGYTSISTKGTIESLLHSQLAFMEQESPDLFDMKFVRDELFYYSRDENQFLRRRRMFTFIFHDDLVLARTKDIELPAQRIVLALALVVIWIHKLTTWLTTDALQFELLFVAKKNQTTQTPLSDEFELLQLLLSEWIERHTAQLEILPTTEAVVARLQERSRTNQVQALSLSTTPQYYEAEGAVLRHLTLATARPELASEPADEDPPNDAIDHWHSLAKHLLALWV